jgi:hypothetical protein
LQIAVETLCLAEVAGDLRDADDPTLLVADRRDGECYREDPAILALSLCLEMDDPLAPADPSEDRGLFVDPVGRDDADDGWPIISSAL